MWKVDTYWMNGTLAGTKHFPTRDAAYAYAQEMAANGMMVQVFNPTDEYVNDWRDGRRI